MQCKYCNHCKQIGRTQAQAQNQGRNLYYCEHPEASKATDNTFVGYGAKTWPSQLTLKTVKRWCPRKAGEPAQ